MANARSGATPGYVGRLHGPFLPGNHKYCLRFYYLLQGLRKVDNGLALYIYDENEVALEKVWSLADTSRSVWTEVEITYMKPMRTKVRRATWAGAGGGAVWTWEEPAHTRCVFSAPPPAPSWCLPASAGASGSVAWWPSMTSPSPWATVRSQQVTMGSGHMAKLEGHSELFWFCFFSFNWSVTAPSLPPSGGRRLSVLHKSC